MVSILYVSSSAGLFSDSELVDLLEQSRDNNARSGITGMLLYKDGNFMQVMEGPEQAVNELYERILKDKRHAGLMLLFKEPIEERQFPSWTMGFRNLRDVDMREMPGYSDFLEESLTSHGFQSDPTRAQRLMLMFRQKM